MTFGKPRTRGRCSQGCGSVDTQWKHRAIFSVNIRMRLLPLVSNLQTSPRSLVLWDPKLGVGGGFPANWEGFGKKGAGQLGGCSARWRRGCGPRGKNSPGAARASPRSPGTGGGRPLATATAGSCKRWGWFSGIMNLWALETFACVGPFLRAKNIFNSQFMSALYEDRYNPGWIHY